MPRVKELFLLDIFVAIYKIKETIKSFENADKLKHNYMAWDSVIREFEIIGEATKHLIENEFLDSSKREIVNFRNVLIHEYFGIDEEEVFDIATSKLNHLLEMIILKIKLINNGLKQELIEDIVEENKHLDFIVEALRELNHA
jgi:uncharacterized protein with HEPN domain